MLNLSFMSVKVCGVTRNICDHFLFNGSHALVSNWILILEQKLENQKVPLPLLYNVWVCCL